MIQIFADFVKNTLLPRTLDSSVYHNVLSASRRTQNSQRSVRPRKHSDTDTFLSAHYLTLLNLSRRYWCIYTYTTLDEDLFSSRYSCRKKDWKEVDRVSLTPRSQRFAISLTVQDARLSSASLISTLLPVPAPSKLLRSSLWKTKWFEDSAMAKAHREEKPTDL